jgi:CRISPR-associated protein Csh2
MNDDNSTFGKKHKLHYGLIAHYGTINKYSAQLTGMTEEDRHLFRQSLVQGMMNNQTDSKQGQTPLLYLEVVYTPEFDGYLGDLRRFLQVEYDENKAIRKLDEVQVDFSKLSTVILEMKEKGYVDKVVAWVHPFVEKTAFSQLPPYEVIDLWASIPVFVEA